MSAKIVHIGQVKFSLKKNASDKVFFRMPFITTLSKMTAKDYFEIGNRKFEKGKYDKAIECYNKSLLLPCLPNNCGIMIMMGNAYFLKKEFAKARECYGKLLEASEKHNQYEGLRNLGNVFYYEKNYSKAIECHELILKDYSEHPKPDLGIHDIKYQLAQFYHALGEIKKVTELISDFFPPKKTTNWLTKPCGMSNYAGGERRELTEEDIKILLGG